MLKNMKIKWRLTLGFSVIIAFIVVLNVLGFDALDKIFANLEKIVKVENVRIQMANDMIDDTREISIAIRNTTLDESMAEEMRNRIVELRGHFDTRFEAFEALIGKEETTVLELISRIKVLRAQSMELNDQVMELVAEGKHEDASELLITKASVITSQWVSTLDTLIRNAMDRNLQRFDDAQAEYKSMSKFMLILTIVILILSLIIVILLTLSITVPLKESVSAANRIADKDLSIQLSDTEKRGDEIGELMQSFSRMVQSLRKQMEEIRDGANTLASSSSEILASTTQIASGAAETATSIGETTTTVEEVRQAAQLSSEKARSVEVNAQHNVQATKTGLKAIEETINEMNLVRSQMQAIANTILNLSEQGQLIGGIIASVNDIADQSNLLAVNAAIEAAKAGEQGKGFSVVAQEIRNMAEQSKKATSQVRTILNDIQKATGAAVIAAEQGGKAVEEGVTQTKKTGETIRMLAESSDESLQATMQISASSQQQLVGMNQIGLAMENINQAGIENAASMKQAENTAKELNELGIKLKKIAEQYKL